MKLKTIVKDIKALIKHQKVLNAQASEVLQIVTSLLHRHGVINGSELVNLHTAILNAMECNEEN